MNPFSKASRVRERIAKQQDASTAVAGRTACVAGMGAGVLGSFLRAETHLWFPKSTVGGMDFLWVLLRLLAGAEEKRDRGRSYVLLIAVLVPAACHRRYSWGLFCVGVERERRDFAIALQNEKWHGSPKRGASSARYGLVQAVILICTPFLHCLIMERRCQGLIGRITWRPVKSR